MKTILALFTLAVGLAVMTPATAQAGHGSSGGCAPTYSRCGNCGGSITRQRVVVGYDRCGEPIYSWRTVFHRCSPPRHNSSRHGHGRGHGH